MFSPQTDPDVTEEPAACTEIIEAPLRLQLPSLRSGTTEDEEEDGRPSSPVSAHVCGEKKQD